MMVLMFILLLVIICIYFKKNKKVIEGIQSFNVAECSSKDNRETLKDGSLHNYHSCNYKNPSYEDYKDKLKGLYINRVPDMNETNEYNYSAICPKKYVKNFQNIFMAC